MAITTLRTKRDFARIWFFWKIPAITVFCLIVVSICLYSFTRTPQYMSTAKVLLLPKTNDELVVSAGQGDRQYDIQRVTGNDINTAVELIKSVEVLNKTARYFNRKDVPGGDDESPSLGKRPGGGVARTMDKETTDLLSALTVEPIYSSNMISVSLQSPDQFLVAEKLNKMLEIYIDYHKSMYLREGSEAFYDGQKQLYAQKLKEARQRLRQYSQYNDITNMEGQINANIQLITDFNGELQNLEVSIAENEAKIRMLERGLNIQGNEVTLSKEMRNMPVIVELARGLVPLLIKRTEISKTFTRESREYRQIDDQIAMLRQEIAKESMNAAKTDRLEIMALKSRREELAKRIEDLKEKNKRFDEKRQELNALELDLQVAKQNYLLYGTKAEDSRLYIMRDKANLSNVVIAEYAVTPSKASSPNRLLAFQVSVILGLFAALILPFILETLDHKIKTEDDVQNALAVPVVCTYNEV